MSNYSESEFSEYGENTSWTKVYNIIPYKSKVLDIGCSSGNFGSVLIEKKDCIVDGIEIDEKDSLLAKKKLRKVYRLNIENDNISDIKEKYDVIYFGDVIEHLVDPINTLIKIKSLLTSDGIVVFSIPNMAHSTIRLLMLKGDFEYTETGLLDKTHLHFYNLDEVQRVFQEAKFDIVKLDFVDKDYPDDLIITELNKLGLKTTDNGKFLKSLHEPNAAAFQFVGIAKINKNNKKGKKLKQFGPIDMFESFHTNTVKNLQDNIDQLNNRILELESDANNWKKFKNKPIKTILLKTKNKIKTKIK